MGTISVERLREIKTLYYDQKLSALQIAKKLGVSLDAVYYFMRHYQLVRRSLSENNAVRFAAKAPSFRVLESFNAEQEKLKIMGVMLYWAEGAKWRGAFGIDFANSDPAMIEIFARFLREICGVKESKLRGRIYCYSNQDVRQLLGFWSEVTAIPESQFTRPYVRYDFDPRKEGKMRYGFGAYGIP